MNKRLELARENLSIEIPPSLLENIEFLFMSDEETSWHPREVTYRFKNGPLKCPFYPGFYYIPGFSRYVIDTTGKVITVKTAKVRKWTNTIPAKESIRGGYLMMPVVSDSGHKFGLTRHRAICLTFKEYDKHPSNFIVNHKNGVGGDDCVDNLEFCTYSENTKHAYDSGLYSNRLVTVNVINWVTGYEETFISVQACCDALNLTHSFITNRLKAGNEKRYEDGWRFKRFNEQWLELNERTAVQMLGKPVAARRIEDNYQFVFESIKQAIEVTKLGFGAIQTQCSSKVGTPVNGWNFRFLEDFSHWPDYTEQQLAIFRDRPYNPSAGVEVHDLESNQILFFTTVDKASEYFDISPVTVSKLARYQAIRQKRYKFKSVHVREKF